MQTLIEHLLKFGVSPDVFTQDVTEFHDGATLHISAYCNSFDTPTYRGGGQAIRCINDLASDTKLCRRCSPDSTSRGALTTIFKIIPVAKTVELIKMGSALAPQELQSAMRIVEQVRKDNVDGFDAWVANVKGILNGELLPLQARLKEKEPIAIRMLATSKGLTDSRVLNFTDEEIRILPPLGGRPHEDFFLEIWRDAESWAPSQAHSAESLAERFFEICSAPECDMLPATPIVPWFENAYFPDWVEDNWRAAVLQICEEKNRVLEKMAQDMVERLLSSPKDHFYIKTVGSNSEPEWSAMSEDLTFGQHFTCARISAEVAALLPPLAIIPATDADLAKVVETATIFIEDGGFPDTPSAFKAALALETSF